MPRKGPAPKRPIDVDPVYGSPVVSQLVSKVLQDGKKQVAQRIVYSALEAIAGIICLVIAWRTRRTNPELGAILAIVPLFFAWRSLFSYFVLLPLFASAAIARMPLGDLAFERVRKLGGLTIFAAPSRS